VNATQQERRKALRDRRVGRDARAKTKIARAHTTTALNNLVKLRARVLREQQILDKAVLAELVLVAGTEPGCLPETDLPTESVARLRAANLVAVFDGVVVAKGNIMELARAIADDLTIELIAVQGVV
jgi:hypothetical protein